MLRNSQKLAAKLALNNIIFVAQGVALVWCAALCLFAFWAFVTVAFTY